MKLKILILGLILLTANPLFAAINDIGGFAFKGVTKTDSNTTNKVETDTVVWTPASGSSIVLMGIKFNSDTATALLVEQGTTAVIPTTECTASGQIVISSFTPIWEGTANQTLTYTVVKSSRHSILLWGYEK